MLTILEHPDWGQLRAFFRAEAYDRDTNVRGYARRRVEVVTPDDPGRRLWLLGTMAPCVSCGRPMHPIRERHGWRTLYYAAACPSSVSASCSRTKAAAQEYRRVVEFLARHRSTPSPTPLFPD